MIKTRMNCRTFGFDVWLIAFRVSHISAPKATRVTPRHERTIILLTWNEKDPAPKWTSSVSHDDPTSPSPHDGNAFEKAIIMVWREHKINKIKGSNGWSMVRKWWKHTKAAFWKILKFAEAPFWEDIWEESEDPDDPLSNEWPLKSEATLPGIQSSSKCSPLELAGVYETLTVSVSPLLYGVLKFQQKTRAGDQI